MNKLIIYFFLFLSLGARAQDMAGKERAGISFYSGYGSQDFRWSIAGNYQGRNPNIYSELTWKKLHSVIAGASARFRIHKRWQAVMEAGSAWTQSGGVTDADYNGDNRTGRTYFGDFASDKGRSLWIAARPGYRLLDKKRMAVLLYAGYGYRFQELKLSERANDSTVIATGLNSSYQTRMHGPLLGIDLQYQLTDRLSLSFAPGYGWLYYSGRGDWNLVTNFKHPLSFEHLANGSEWKGRLDIRYTLSGVQVFAGMHYQHTEINGGDDVLYLSDGTVLKSHFNGASGHAFMALAGVTIFIDN